MPFLKLKLHEMTDAQWEAAFPDEEACEAYLVYHRWPAGVTCPRCKSRNVFDVGHGSFKWRCYSCPRNYSFNPTTDTLLGRSRTPLTHWFRVIHWLATRNQAPTTDQVRDVLNLPNKIAAWRLCHRVRLALIGNQLSILLGIATTTVPQPAIALEYLTPRA